MKNIKFIQDGNLSGWLRTVLCLIGAVIVYISACYVHSMLLLGGGLFLAAVGGYSSRAHMLRIKPFDNSFKKARESYKKGDAEKEGGGN
ncbi:MULTISPECIES: hypothetical protein [Mycetohabitans]|uniref:hypothetical protein n=1 Tax=Mycetohabitans TaxID=2571159 RepID=UPI001F446A99|nr:hypothetical protein [Mycetohabitans sp. B3]MCF2132963.1 hypothetical protein [Mycetohabitans sp. B3]